VDWPRLARRAFVVDFLIEIDVSWRRSLVGFMKTGVILPPVLGQRGAGESLLTLSLLAPHLGFLFLYLAINNYNLNLLTS